MINCEYFNNLNDDGPHNHPHTQLKKSEIPHTHTQSMRGFSVKTGTGSGNTHGNGFICHLYLYFCQRSVLSIMRFVRLYFAKHQLFPYLIRLRVASLHLYKVVPFSIHSLIGPRYTQPIGSGCSRPSCLANVPIALCWAAVQRGHP